MQTVRDACQFDPNAIDYALSDQIESLEDLVGHDGTKAQAFFRQDLRHRRHADAPAPGAPAPGRRLGPGRLRDEAGDGGGKTHSMLALGYLSVNPALTNLVPPEITRGFKPVQARVVAISGRTVSRDKHLWGDVAEQLGKADQFAEFFKGAPKAPNEKDWVALIGDEPALILLDELPPYFGYAVTPPVGSGTLAEVATYALSNLLSAALKLKRLCVVVSSLSGSYQGATQQLSALIQKSVGNLQQEAGRRPRRSRPSNSAPTKSTTSCGPPNDGAAGPEGRRRCRVRVLERDLRRREGQVRREVR